MSVDIIKLIIKNQLNHSIYNHNTVRLSIQEETKREQKREKTRKSTWKYEEITDSVYFNLDSLLATEQDVISAYRDLVVLYENNSIVISNLFKDDEIYYETKKLYIPHSFPGLVGNRQISFSGSNMMYSKRHEFRLSFYINVFEDESAATAWKIIK